ncbi:restriction endonuclease subunit S [Metamycoplasma cloacale]|uniref:restriction endonuclease subunit S n=1 Tax=Metamycoplasma cloacale TaxID=92401 RepID=UPI000A52E996|nr:restriction endonuclease subunit S [Metamycoplasma cloacale]
MPWRERERERADLAQIINWIFEHSISTTLKQISFKNETNIQWKRLDEISTIKTGQPINQTIISQNIGKYPVINSGKNPLGYINKWNTENDPIGIASRGTVGYITYTEGRYFRGNLNYSVTIKDKKVVNQKFLYYLLLANQNKIFEICNYNGVPALNSADLKEMELPIPPIEIQNNIVKILDKFDLLINDLTEGLPKEIKLREKQYEYYSNLIFKKLSK